MSADAPVVLQLSNVESAYGPIRAIRGVSLQVIRGQIATVLGSNGAGKSTILKTISGIIDPRKGSIKFKGEDITARDPALIVQRGLSHVPEGREVFPLLSVHDNLLMGAYTRKDRDGVARDMQAVYGYFPILRERAAQDAGLLSGGQQQMLAISRALMAAPELILLDEPSLGLSPRLTREIFEIVIRINRERGTTILLVEHPLPPKASRIAIVDPKTTKLRSGRSSDGPWVVQVGAFKTKSEARTQLAMIERQFQEPFADAQQQIAAPVGGNWRAQFKGFSEGAARQACSTLKSRKQPCMVVSPN